MPLHGPGTCVFTHMVRLIDNAGSTGCCELRVIVSMKLSYDQMLSA
jgi:hypothetical protein